MDTPDPIVTWLLESEDPALRYQTLRNLTDTPPAELAQIRARIPHEGLAAQILAAQGENGAWHRDDDTPDWLPTLFMFQLLRATAADPADPTIQSAVDHLEAGFRWADDLGSKPFSEGETEPCINGGALAASSYFGRPSHTLAARLLAEQLPDGGWNCDAPQSQRSSYHSTICVLEGLLEFELAAGPDSPLTTASAEARLRAHEYLLDRRLFRRLSTGQPASPEFLQLAWPTRYHYDILRALDYFRSTGLPPDPRTREAIQLIESKRQPDGRWLLEACYDESLSFPWPDPIGEPSRWITLRAQRVLRWSRIDPLRAVTISVHRPSDPTPNPAA
ncbi:hypothetical protein [Occallatibacter riparius]|uniref:Squalene cyclase C-terminal domain-containing protein n=1 Tax=Occallatibacter riparius TaxID=1002689 RepID=A0A9J7BXQ7_9BACT|nr:hypothetical protein [Occallatibacter riparius]UWZ86013.1 hypothetical protein MOP44_08720 [Occallatibacter riparius]